ncbi:MAG: polysaccharide deacetylase family protein, partial [Oscillospiraceae bacterium]|nr:polysaccharide deacetylase family protein [Oscillospiraceae bacterium]
MKLKHILRSTAVCAATACALTSASLTGCAQEETKLIALTFDDGPNTTTTAAVLDVLEKYDVTASFFLIGDNITDESAAMVRRAYDIGCEINSHSRTHSYMSGMTAEEIRGEIEYTDNAVYEIIGTYPQFFRPPYIDVSQTMYDAIDKPFICGIGCGDASSDV